MAQSSSGGTTIMIMMMMLMFMGISASVAGAVLFLDPFGFFNSNTGAEGVDGGSEEDGGVGGDTDTDKGGTVDDYQVKFFSDKEGDSNIEEFSIESGNDSKSVNVVSNQDKYQSVKVGAKAEVEVFEDKTYGGKHKKFGPGFHVLEGTEWGKMISSIKIKKKKETNTESDDPKEVGDTTFNPDDNCVIFYDAFDGITEIGKKCIDKDNKTAGAFNVYDMNDKVASIKIGKNVKLKAYSEDYFNTEKGKVPPEGCTVKLPFLYNGGNGKTSTVLSKGGRGCGLAQGKGRDPNKCYREYSSETTDFVNMNDCMKDNMTSYLLEEKTSGSTSCKKYAQNECASFRGKDRDKCISSQKKKCIEAGGYW